MLRQYFQTKEAHPGVLLAMRVGDFYEFYGEDAETAAEALQITLTGREDGANGRVAMAGVPYHSVEKYLARLVQAGFKVALCDQVEDPKTAKGLVRRAVTRVLTPGTLVEDSMLQPQQSNFLTAIAWLDARVGIATLETSTGEFAVTEVDGDASERVLQELARLGPAEVLLDARSPFAETVRGALNLHATDVAAPDASRAHRTLVQHFQVNSLAGFGCDDKPAAILAAAMVLDYARANGLNLAHVDGLATYSVDAFMILDPATRRSLELTQNMTDGSRRFTLLAVLDETVTSMGARLMKRWIDQPLLDIPTITARQDALARFLDQPLIRGDVRDELKKLGDVERLVSRVATDHAGPRDLAGLRSSLACLPMLVDALRVVGFGRLQELIEQIGDHALLFALLSRAIVDEPPHSVREGGFIREGYDVELDKLRSLTRDGRQFIADLEAAERQRTGLSNLKVGFNSVFGYYLEVAKKDQDKVPAEYVRKQTTANAERYITAELKEHESSVLGAAERASSLEYDLFVRLRHRIAEHSRDLLQTARALAEVDALAALAEVAAARRYVRPALVEGDELRIVAGRHPVVEAQRMDFVPNDVAFGPTGEGADARLVVLTGPNMSGKSTYLRQTALIVLLAQIGSFVPAEACTLGLCDRIFARIGAKDELALGQSTFMVEMVESAAILNHASPRSLVILDEVGRGTSTYDGLAIAWAMVEHLAAVGAKTMFATHYHQLNALADQIPGVANFRVSVEEYGDEIVWTHRVLPGGTDRSYGIHVARMAGVPPSVLRRAAEVLAELEQVDQAPRAVRPGEHGLQLSLFEVEESPIVRDLRDLDVDRMTPIEALRLLDQLKKRATS